MQEEERRETLFQHPERGVKIPDGKGQSIPLEEFTNPKSRM